MAKRISTPVVPTLGAPPKYPWARWSDGSAWRITRGEDFEVPTTSMAAIVRAYARRNGMLVATRRTSESVEFQFVRPAEPSEAAA